MGIYLIEYHPFPNHHHPMILLQAKMTHWQPLPKPMLLSAHLSSNLNPCKVILNLKTSAFLIHLEKIKLSSTTFLSRFRPTLQQRWSGVAEQESLPLFPCYKDSMILIKVQSLLMATVYPH